MCAFRHNPDPTTHPPACIHTSRFATLRAPAMRTASMSRGMATKVCCFSASDTLIAHAHIAPVSRASHPSFGTHHNWVVCLGSSVILFATDV